MVVKDDKEMVSSSPSSPPSSPPISFTSSSNESPSKETKSSSFISEIDLKACYTDWSATVC